MLPTTIRSVFASMLLTAVAAAQCPFTMLSAQSAGPHCNLGPTGCCAVAEQPTQLLPALDTTLCRLNLQVQALEGCCGVTVAVRLLAIGTAPANIPLPQLGSGCGLWVQPDAILVAQAPTFVLAIPPTLTPFTFYAQSSALITNVLFPAPTVVTLSGALALSLQ